MPNGHPPESEIEQWRQMSPLAQKTWHDVAHEGDIKTKGVAAARRFCQWCPISTWTCHVCKEERPDAAISVRKHALMIAAEQVGQQNVRYCNDRPECIEGSKQLRFIPDSHDSLR